MSDMLMATFGDTSDQRHEPIDNSATGNGIAGGARAVTDMTRGRDLIMRVKEYLREQGIDVEDLPGEQTRHQPERVDEEEKSVLVSVD